MKRFFLAICIFIIGITSAMAEDSSKKKIEISVKEMVSAPAEKAYLSFVIEAEDENAVDAETRQRNKQETILKLLNLPIVNEVAEVKTASLLLGPMTISFNTPSNIQPTNTVILQEYTIVICDSGRKLIKQLSRYLDAITEYDTKTEKIIIKYEAEHPEALKKRAYDAALEKAKQQALLITNKLGR